jgi:ribonuclease Z
MTEDGKLTRARFSGSEAFARSAAATPSTAGGGVLLKEASFQVRAATLQHSIPVLAFAIEERAHVNIWRNKLETLGLSVGPWLRAFKDAILRGAPDETSVQVAWSDPEGKPATLPLGKLKQEIMQITSGRKIAYVVDVAYTEANISKIVALAQDADILFIEATFLEKDADKAAARQHLTACQAGTLARLAGAKRLVTLHYSPRYQGHGEMLAAEALAAFKTAPVSAG